MVQEECGGKSNSASALSVIAGYILRDKEEVIQRGVKRLFKNIVWGLFGYCLPNVEIGE